MTIIPPSAKSVTSVIRRAEELEKSNDRDAKVVAYYCRMFAVTKITQMKNLGPEESSFINSQLLILEKVKPQLALTAKEGPDICRNYAIMVFNKADDEDRLGNADRATVKMFYAAGTFFDILEQFCPLEPEVCVISSRTTYYL